ncbi:DUF4199 domain-containing protein [Dyadobacter sp. NIV53]|uniref:DUF4199 domain-containing protein n=1 Tax=Dyadobacter sp. NIV53 TaxID=2861765 RepID=UPI001C878B9C|nr:DUF4199 domain-containing protein [Dyadobacter sp. NIV53]
MRRNVIVCGLISGIILAGFMVVVTSICYQNEDFQSSMVLGYSSMILAFSLIFVGVKNLRDKFNNGFITFGKAFRIGIYITLIASTMYVLAWVIDYYLFIPDFMDKYTAHVMREIKAAGADQMEIDKKAAEMLDYKEMYKNPLLVLLLTYMEVIPVGLVVSLISALILKRKSKTQITV